MWISRKQELPEIHWWQKRPNFWGLFRFFRQVWYCSSVRNHNKLVLFLYVDLWCKFVFVLQYYAAAGLLSEMKSWQIGFLGSPVQKDTRQWKIEQMGAQTDFWASRRDWSFPENSSWIFLMLNAAIRGMLSIYTICVIEIIMKGGGLTSAKSNVQCKLKWTDKQQSHINRTYSP